MKMTREEARQAALAAEKSAGHSPTTPTPPAAEDKPIITEVCRVGAWVIHRADKRDPATGKTLTKFIASTIRQESPKDVFHSIQTDVVVSTFSDSVEVYGYRVRDNKAVSGIGGGDAVPIPVLATLIGFREDALRSGIIVPGGG